MRSMSRMRRFRRNPISNESSSQHLDDFELKLADDLQVEHEDMIRGSLIPYDAERQVIAWVQRDDEEYTLYIDDSDAEGVFQKTFKSKTSALDEFEKLASSHSLIFMGQNMKGYGF